MNKRLIAIALLLTLSLNSVAFANGFPDLSQLAAALSPGDTQSMLRGLAALSGDPTLMMAVELFSFVWQWFGTANKLPARDVVGTREIRGHEAYEILKTWGLVKPGMSPHEAVVVFVETRGGARAAYTPEELQRSGWHFNPATEQWEPGPSARDLPARASLRIKATPRGQTEVLAGMDFPITVFWEIEVLKPDGSIAEKTSGSSQVNIPGMYHQVPKCDNVFEGAIGLPGGMGNVGFKYIYHTYSAVSTASESEERTSNCDRILEQPTSVSVYSENRLLNHFVEGAEGEPGGLRRQSSNDSFQLMNAFEQRRANQTDNQNNTRRPSLPPIGGSSLGMGSSLGTIGAGSLRSQINDMSKYQFADLNDQRDFTTYLNEESYMVDNARTEQEYQRIRLRLMSVDEMIRNNNYTPGRLGDAIKFALSNIAIDSDPISNLVGDPRMSSEGGDSVGNMIHTFLMQF